MEAVNEIDLLVIGGGINGCGIARDAAGRGLTVMLCEKDDIASHTSSLSSKLIHGGLRYLENYEFSMVRSALREREVLMNIAPHSIWPMRFVLPHAKHLRPAWMIRIGMFLYDNLARRDRLPRSSNIDLRTSPEGEPLKPASDIAFTYSDCATLDSRLTVLNALDAQERGAEILTRTTCVSAERDGGYWQVTLKDEAGERKVRARAIVNATGPWARQFIDDALNTSSEFGIRLVQGSHIIVPKLFEHESAYIFQNADNRIVFAIPYEHDFTLIGTTDVDYQDDPQTPRITQDETDYLCALCNEYFKQQITPEDVVSSYSGVRPLFDDASSNSSKVSRGYVLDLQRGANGNDAPVLNIFGGKLTAYRQLAEKSLDKLLPAIDVSAEKWTADTCLPGGDIADGDFQRFIDQQVALFPKLPATLIQRYGRQFGTRISDLLKGVTEVADLGEDFGAAVYAREVEYLVEKEWARTAEDILWRRTRQGLHADDDTPLKIERYLEKRLST